MDLRCLVCLVFLNSLTPFPGQSVLCPPGQWQCDDSSCIPDIWRCDGDGDCLDRSDEMDCNGASDCPPGQFSCVDSVDCVDSSARCDGKKQCPTGFDEENCAFTSGCLESDWTCRNKLCIPKGLRCNGHNDCLDNSDEEDCDVCGDGNIQCPEGSCLPAEKRCDGQINCSDGSDEPITCGRVCSRNNGGCSHMCVDEPWGALCDCPDGYELSDNGADCRDVAECSPPFAPCMQDCTNTDGSYYCHCKEGFTLRENSVCEATGNATRIVTVQMTSIGLLTVKTQQFEVIQTAVFDPVALTFDLSRGLYYWADGQGNIHSSDGQQSLLIYTGERGIKSLACNWLNGQLYWTNQETESIYMLTADWKSHITVLSKHIRPSELVLLPVESSMFWINVGPGDTETIEKSWMDGSVRSSLLVLTAQAAHGLTADVAARRLYWISDFKKSIESVKVDGTGRYSLNGLFSRGAQSLAVFESSFYWVDDKGLWQVPQNRPNQKKFIWKGILPLIGIYHELQQPQGPSACTAASCDLCLLTKNSPMGVTCTCPKFKLLLPDGKCDYPRFVYATSHTINLLEFSDRKSNEVQLFSSSDSIVSFDISWYRHWLYWADERGRVRRTSLTQVKTEDVPTPIPVCLIKVDQRSGSLYWVSCDQMIIGTVGSDGRFPQKLYETTAQIQDIYLNWLADELLWLEGDRIFSMRKTGGATRQLLRLREGVTSGIAFDLRANSLLWISKSAGLITMSLLQERSHIAGKRWNISGSVAVALEPLLLTLSENVLTLWDRRDGSQMNAAVVKRNAFGVIPALKEVSPVPTVQPCKKPSFLCPNTSVCLSQDQLCDGKIHCPTGDDERFCITTCPSRGDFRCIDRSDCVPQKYICDGRSHCHDGSDEVNCPTLAPHATQAKVLRCRKGSVACRDGTSCVSYTHVCDGEVDCKDGSDEEGCDATVDKVTPPTQTSTQTTTPPIQTTTATTAASTMPPCYSPSMLCPHTYLCISPTHICDGVTDCPDGSDEKNCIKKCRSRNEFRCKDRQSCIPKNLVCDGHSHCFDGSDEADCTSVTLATAQAKVLTCRRNSRMCRDQTQCVLYSHVCDGETDCRDGSDEDECDKVTPPTQTSTQTTTPPIQTTTATTAASTRPPCYSPSMLCPHTYLCISPTHICNGVRDCPDGSDEKNCIRKCRSRNEFRCKDRQSCIPKNLVCDGHSHCFDGSDEADCPGFTPVTTQAKVLTCRRNSRMCRDQTQCVLYSHVCDGERDCRDGSDEDECDATVDKVTPPTQTSTQTTTPPIQTTTATTAASTMPPCYSPSMLCPHTYLCISPTDICNGIRDCPDGSDEKNCIRKCRSRNEFRCKDRQSCIPKKLLCDGHSHCFDGSDEADCPSVSPATAQAKVLTCRRNSRMCRDQTQCVLYSHVCDGETDCRDGSDEDECALDPTTTVLAGDPLLKESPPVGLSTQLPPRLSCTNPSVLCPDLSACVLQTQYCDGKEDCQDGSDESCVNTCPHKTDFRCKDRRRCISESLVCDGHAHCFDRSDEVNCPTLAIQTTPWNVPKCRRNSRLCRDQRQCVLYSHVCDGERDCRDGSDEDECGVAVAPSCTSPSVLCAGSSVCILQTQFCDGKKDCPDGSDEKCPTTCPNPSDYLCGDDLSCISATLVCDGRSHCNDGSDELNCASASSSAVPQDVLKCRRGAKPCKDGSACVLHSHVCDGENDCADGSDEQGCQQTCKLGEFQCAHGRKCIPAAQVCDGRAHCLDQSDEGDCWKQTKSCEFHCADGKRCIPRKFLCDGDKDCLDGTDEVGCDGRVTVPPTVSTTSRCITPSVLCPRSSVCVSQNQICNGQKDCPDGFDEDNCMYECKNPADFLCSDRSKCVPKRYVCDNRIHCSDGSDEKQCRSEPTTRSPTTQASVSTRPPPVRCRIGFRSCKDGLECVLHSHVCDGELDCKDGSDEDDCVTKCKEGHFQCSHGKKCIPQQQVCDGHSDCQDRSDEVNCTRVTEGCHLFCDNKTRCIPETFLCDGERDCTDGSDEEKCGLVPCASHEYRCMSGQCVDQALRCDSYADCRDHSDEKGCSRPPRCLTEIQCPHSHECLQKEWICDGEEDCNDGSDEKNCATPPVECREYQWNCGDNSHCIPLSWRCDGTVDCRNGKDEDKCNQRNCPSHLYQCNSGECVEPRLVCNGIRNCADRSEEGVGCVQRNCSSPSAPRCDHHCVSTPNGPRCYCAAGFKLHSSGLSCVDVDECNVAPHTVCKHICLNTRGSYVCHCHPGFYLESDNRSCKTEDEPLLLASVQSEMLLLGVHSATLRLLSARNRPVFSLDYHWAQQRVYWLSSNYESIRWTDMNNPNSKGTLIKGVKSDFIAVDWVGNNLYWVDGLVGQILAVKLSHVTLRSQNSTVVLGEDLEQPSSLVLLSHRGLMLWSEIGSTPQIERSGMDGSRRKVVVSRGLIWPVSLTFDLLDSRIYWVDEKLHCIGSASLDGDNIKILQLAEAPSPFSVAVFNDRIFLSDTKRRTIRSADKNTGKDQKILLKRPGQPFGLKVMHAYSQPSISSPCDQMHCSHLCLLTPAGRGQIGRPTAVCRCPKGLLLSKDKITCSLPTDMSFILLLSQKKVYQIPLQSMHRDGVTLKKMPNSRVLSFPGLTEASALDISIPGQFLYVADAGQGSVDVLKMSSSRSRQGLTPAGHVLKLTDDAVTALAVDWSTSNLYWSSTQRPDLHVTARNNYTALVLVASVKETTSIALHPPSSKLCYAAVGAAGTKSQSEVNCAWMDGRKKALLWRKSTIPTSLVFSSDGAVIYWADAAERIINCIGLDGSGFRQYKPGPGLLVSLTYVEHILIWVTLDKDVTKLWFSDGLQPKQLWFETKTSLIEVKAYSSNSQSGTNSCSNNNGGCVQLCLPYPGGRKCTCGRGFYTVNVTSCSPLPICPTQEISCSDGSKCISSSKFCDGRLDCEDESDEQDCPNKIPFSPRAETPSLQSPSNVGADATKVSAGLANKASGSCDLGCSSHGTCVTEGTASVCRCDVGYSGEFCQEAETGQGHAGVGLGLFCLVVVLLAAAVFYVKRRSWLTFQKSKDKESLVGNIILPPELFDSDSEEVESPIDMKSPQLGSESQGL